MFKIQHRKKQELHFYMKTNVDLENTIINGILFGVN